VGLSIKPTPAAAAQIRKESRWWRTNRPKAPKLFREELRGVFDLISAYPEAGAFSEDADLTEVRRILLPATKHYLYYRVNKVAQSIEILALWSTHRGDRPTF
jgi:plasmid stabilization system protein ParE